MGNLGNSLNPLSFLKCEVGRGQWWAASEVTDAKLCEGPIHAPVPPRVLCGENGRSTANTLPSSGSGPKSPLTGVYYKHRFPSGSFLLNLPANGFPAHPELHLVSWPRGLTLLPLLPHLSPLLFPCLN